MSKEIYKFAESIIKFPKFDWTWYRRTHEIKK